MKSFRCTAHPTTTIINTNGTCTRTRTSSSRRRRRSYVVVTANANTKMHIIGMNNCSCHGSTCCCCRRRLSCTMQQHHQHRLRPYCTVRNNNNNNNNRYTRAITTAFGNNNRINNYRNTVQSYFIPPLHSMMQYHQLQTIWLRYMTTTITTTTDTTTSPTSTPTTSTSSTAIETTTTTTIPPSNDSNSSILWNDHDTAPPTGTIAVIPVSVPTTTTATRTTTSITFTTTVPESTQIQQLQQKMLLLEQQQLQLQQYNDDDNNGIQSTTIIASDDVSTNDSTTIGSSVIENTFADRTNSDVPIHNHQHHHHQYHQQQQYQHQQYVEQQYNVLIKRIHAICSEEIYPIGSILSSTILMNHIQQILHTFVSLSSNNNNHNNNNTSNSKSTNIVPTAEMMTAIFQLLHRTSREPSITYNNNTDNNIHYYNNNNVSNNTITKKKMMYYHNSYILSSLSTRYYNAIFTIWKNYIITIHTANHGINDQFHDNNNDDDRHYTTTKPISSTWSATVLAQFVKDYGIRDVQQQQLLLPVTTTNTTSMETFRPLLNTLPSSNATSTIDNRYNNAMNAVSLPNNGTTSTTFTFIKYNVYTIYLFVLGTYYENNTISKQQIRIKMIQHIMFTIYQLHLYYSYNNTIEDIYNVLKCYNILLQSHIQNSYYPSIDVQLDHIQRVLLDIQQVHQHHRHYHRMNQHSNTDTKVLQQQQQELQPIQDATHHMVLQFYRKHHLVNEMEHFIQYQSSYDDVRRNNSSDENRQYDSTFVSHDYNDNYQNNTTTTATVATKSQQLALSCWKEIIHYYMNCATGVLDNKKHLSSSSSSSNYQKNINNTIHHNDNAILLFLQKGQTILQQQMIPQILLRHSSGGSSSDVDNTNHDHALSSTITSPTVDTTVDDDEFIRLDPISSTTSLEEDIAELAFAIQLIITTYRNILQRQQYKFELFFENNSGKKNKSPHKYGWNGQQQKQQLFMRHYQPIIDPRQHEARDRIFASAELFYQSIKRLQQQTNSHMFSELSYQILDGTMMDIYANAGRVDRAVETFNQLDNPDLLQYSILMKAYGNGDLANVSEQILLSLLNDIDTNVSINDCSRENIEILFHTVINAWAISTAPNIIERVHNVLTLMKEHPKCIQCNIQPNVVTYTTILKSLLNAITSTNSVNSIATDVSRYSEEIINEMERAYKKHGDENIKPNLGSYSTAIKVCLQANDYTRAESLLRRLETSRDIVTSIPSKFYNDLIHQCTMPMTAAAAIQGEKFLQHMIKLSIKLKKPSLLPNERLYNKVMDTWILSHDNDANSRLWNLYQQMAEHQSDAIGNRTYATLIPHFAKSGNVTDIEHADEILQSMELRYSLLEKDSNQMRYADDSIMPYYHHYVPVIRGYLNVCNDVEKATKVLIRQINMCVEESDSDEKKRMVSPLRSIYLPIITGWTKSGQVDKATLLIKQIQDLYDQQKICYGPCIRCYHILLHAYMDLPSQSKRRGHYIRKYKKIIEDMKKDIKTKSTEVDDLLSATS